LATPSPTPRNFNNGVIEGRRIAENIWVANGSDCGYIFNFQRDVNAYIDANYPDDGTWDGDAFRRGVQIGADSYVDEKEKECLEDNPDECIAIGENAAQEIAFKFCPFGPSSFAGIDYKEQCREVATSVCVGAVGKQVQDNGCDITTSELLVLQKQCRGVVDVITDATPDPTASPINLPTENPTEKPTESPTESPTKRPTESPTGSPTETPTGFPTDSPTETPTLNPTLYPTLNPTFYPTLNPTLYPTVSPTEEPTWSPTFYPTVSPTSSPSVSSEPSVSSAPSTSASPSESPTVSSRPSPKVGFLPDPTPDPSASPTYSPTLHPRPFGKSSKSSSDSSKSGKAKTLKDSGSKSGKSAKSVDKDDYKGLFGDYKRVTAPLQKQGFEVSYNKSSARRSEMSVSGYWLTVVTACILGTFSLFTIGL
jgi:hypothetical protein